MFGRKKKTQSGGRIDTTVATASSKGLDQLGEALRAECEDLATGNERILTADPGIITGPAGVESDEWDEDSCGWFVLTNTRLQFRRLDYDRVRVAFLSDLKLTATEETFDHYAWQDRATLRNISFGFPAGADTREQLRSLTKS